MTVQEQPARPVAQRARLPGARSFVSIAVNPAVEIPLPVAQVLPDGTVAWCNSAWRAMASTVGASPDLLADATGVDDGSLGRLLQMLHATIESPPRPGSSNTAELDVPNLGLYRWTRCHASAGVAGSAVLTVVPLRALPPPGSGPDPDEFVAAYEYLSEGIVVLDEQMQIRIATGFATSLMGQPGFEYEGRNALDEIHPDDRDRAVAAFVDILRRSGEQTAIDIRVRDADGEYRWLEAVATNLFEHPIVCGMLVMLRDVGGRKRLEAELAHRALHDALTGLPNRGALIQRLTTAVADQRTSEHSLAVMFLDLDNLKDVNDSVGHDAGDTLLVEVARRLRAAAGPSDVVGRLAGDEFVMICPLVIDADDALDRADRIRRALTGRSLVGGTDVFVSASVGLVVVPPRDDPGEPAEDAALRLLREADTAMYQAKLRGRAGVVRFSADMQERANTRLRQTAALDRAVVESQLELRYRPVVDLAERRPVRIDALVRWEHPEFGAMEPTELVELAVTSGLIAPLGAWVLDRALADLADLRRSSDHLAELGVSVDVAAGQLMRAEFADQVVAALHAHRLPPEALVLEISEPSLLDVTTTTVPALDRLRDVGVRVCLDDFGTGRSSVSHLRRLAVDELKLDASFLVDIVDSPVNSDICRAMVQLAHAIGMKVVAGAVDTSAQLDVLRGLGCDLGQGALFGTACRATELSSVLVPVRLRR